MAGPRWLAPVLFAAIVLAGAIAQTETEKEAPRRRLFTRHFQDKNVCPLEAVFKEKDAGAKGPLGGDAELAGLVDGLVASETHCYSTCIRAVRHHADMSAARLKKAFASCRACVDDEAEAQRKAVMKAMDAANNAVCKVAAPSKDRCFITTINKYSIVESSVRRPSRDGNFETVRGGWYMMPDEVRAETGAMKPYQQPGCPKACMPTDGVGSIFSVVFSLYAAALETGCTLVYPELQRVAHGVNLMELNDFFRASTNCLQGDQEEELAPLQHQVIETLADKLAARELAKTDAPAAGTIYYTARDELCGPAYLHSFRLGHLRGGMLICGKRHAAVLARLVLRAKFETGQDRSTQVRRGLPPPGFVAAVPSKASNQLAGSAWFDPLGAGPGGKLQLNVVLHVRRGDVNLAAGATHHAGGIYASHYVPLKVVTEALNVLMAAWGPLAEKLGLFFNVLVASEGTEADFPTKEWRRIVAAHGQMSFKLRAYDGQQGQMALEMEARAANLTALDTMGQMMDADILLADGKSLFSLTANAWAVNSLFITYPWLLQLGSPLRDLLDSTNSSEVIDGKAIPTATPLLHPVYQKMRETKAPGGTHPGSYLLHDAHKSQDYRTELQLLYEHRQTAVLQGLLGSIVAKKRRALERGAHFNWVGY